MDSNNRENYFKYGISLLNNINELQVDYFRKIITLIKLIKQEYHDLTITIKTPNPITDKRWGDYFFALALKKSFKKKGFNVLVQEREHWGDCDSDIVIVLRGAIEYTPKFYNLNLMWNISHPDDISSEEFEMYDIVFVASNEYADELNDKLETLVHPLLQCTDPEIFFPEKSNEFHENILFVGVTRGIFRKVIADILETNKMFSVYGVGWEEFIDAKYIKGQFIDNDKLHKAYSSCNILLNDHWEDMLQRNFVSNRIFDALACKTFVISDDVESINSLFEGNVVTYNDSKDLNEKLEYYLTHETERLTMANEGYEIVIKNHTFDNRVSEILSVIEKKYFFEFLKQSKKDFNDDNSKKTELIIFNYLFDVDYDGIIDENKSMNIEIARLNERIYFLEQAMLFHNKNKGFKSYKDLFNFFS